jgi:hypothetical protein
MRLSDAGLHQRQTKALYPNHRPPPWLTEDATPRSLQPIVRRRCAPDYHSPLMIVKAPANIEMNAMTMMKEYPAVPPGSKTASLGLSGLT